MVGLNSSAIRDFCKDKLLSSPLTCAPDPLVPKFDDFSVPLDDAFPDFDLDDWILEPDHISVLMEGEGLQNPQLVSPEETHQAIVSNNASPDGTESKRAEFSFHDIVDSCLDGSDLIPAGGRCLDESALGRVEFRASEEKCQGANVEEPCPDGSRPGFGILEKSGAASISIEEEMEKVSLVGTSNVIDVISDIVRGEERDGSVRIDECNVEAKSKEEVNVESRVSEKGVTDGNIAEIGEIVSERDDRDSGVSESSESEDSSSSSSSEEETDSDNNEEDDDSDDNASGDRKEKDREMDDVGEVEEGEIRDFDREEIVLSSEDEESGGVKGPIKSKNETEILPPVPPVNVVLQPHHQMLPVGVVLSMMGTKVIVEGLEKHNPLNEGSILWISGSKLPLGLVDEIFGPVKNPYYIVRFNSEEEVPAGICEGTAISFVSEFVDHILKDKSLYKKGYDASGENDEEVSEEAEFSDDEKEAEYKRSLRMAKKGKDRRGNREFDGQKRVQFKGQFHKNVQPSNSPAPVAVRPHAPMGMGMPFVPGQLQGPQVLGPSGCGNCGCSFGSGQVGTSGPTCVPPQNSHAQTADLQGPPPQLFLQPNAVWTNGMPTQQQQHMGLLNVFQMNGVPHSQSMGGSNAVPYNQQFVPNQVPLPAMQSPCGQLNPCAGPISTNLPGFMAHGCFNQVPFGMGIQSQQVHHMHPGMNGQGVPGFGPFSGQLPPALNQGSFSTPQQFDPGAASNRGRKPYPRGGRGNFPGRRSWRPTR